MSFRKRVKEDSRDIRRAVMLVLLLFAVTPGWAFDADEGLPGDWLSRYATPFSIGMGGATVSAGVEPQAALWNPAGLSWLRRNCVQATNVRLFDDTSVIGLGFAVPSNRMPTFGLNLLYLKSDEFERTTELNESLGTFNEGDLVMALTASHQVADRWSAGANVKLVRQTVEDFSGAGAGFDLGLLGEVVPGVKVGVSALNLGGPTITLREKDETYAREYRSGMSVVVFEGDGLVSAEAVSRDGADAQLRLGGQFRVSSLSLRLGYYIENIAAGFSYDFDSGLSLDYGMNDHELGVVHRFGLRYVFAGFYTDSQASPDVFSPMGRNPVTKFLLTANTRVDVRDWQLTIRDRSGEIVRSYAGQGQPPAHIIWDGKDAAGLPLPDGSYVYVLKVTENDGRVTYGRARDVEINTGGPRGSIGVE